MNPFTAIPFFRIILPYAGGISFFRLLDIELPLFSCFLFLILLLISIPFRSANARRWSLLIADLFLFCLASNQLTLTRAPLSTNYFANLIQQDTTHIFLARINDIPVSKARSRKFELKIVAVAEKNKWKACRGKVILNIPKSPFSHHLKAGDRIQVKVRLLAIEGPLNPGEFNYRDFLANRNIQRRGYADSTAIIRLPEQKESFEIWYFALKVKSAVLNRLQNSGLTADAMSISSALLTGFDDEIDKDVLSAFSHSGTLHILSVSGLHTGLIYSVLVYLFRLWDRNRRYKKLEFFIIVSLLWAFALFTGFSPPVLRAVIMFSLLGAGRLFFRSTAKNQINILCASAFFMLLYEPYLLFDLGFILSYGAMFGLLYYQASFQFLFTFNSKALNYLWSSVCASFSATLSTLPITLYFFKQFPLWFVLCNLIVVPASFVLLLLAFLSVLGLPYVTEAANLLTTYMVAFVTLFDSEQNGYIANIDFRLSDALCLSCAIIFFTLAFARHSCKLLFIAIFTILGWQLLALRESALTKRKEQIIVFSIRKGQAVAVKKPGQLLLALRDSSAYDYSVRPWVTAQNNAKTGILRSEVLRVGDEYFVSAVRKDSLPELPREQIRFLVCGGKFNITENLLKTLSPRVLIVLGGSKDRLETNRVIELCRKFEKALWVLSLEGALQIGIRSKHYEVENWR